jgi:uncharacterized protein involved in oxidation of intracellular sulfur
MKTLFIVNGAPYGTETGYNALRLARTLLKTEGSEVRLFLIGDGAACAHGGQKVPQGYYNIADMLGIFLRHGGEVGVCGTCLDARGITDAMLVDGAKRGSMDSLAAWTTWADKVLVF